MIYSQDKHYLCGQCFKPGDWQTDDIIVAPRQWASIDKCCACGLQAVYGAIVRVEIPGPCCGSHWRKAEETGIKFYDIRQYENGAVSIGDDIGCEVESNLPYFERMIAKWDAQGPGQPDGVKL